MAEKTRVYGEAYPIDEDFLAALRLMPEASVGHIGLQRDEATAMKARKLTLSTGSEPNACTDWTMPERVMNVWKIVKKTLPFVGTAFFIGTAKCKMALTDGAAHIHIVAPAFYNSYGRRYFVKGYVTSRCRQANGIACF